MCLQQPVACVLQKYMSGNAMAGSTAHLSSSSTACGRRMNCHLLRLLQHYLLLTQAAWQLRLMVGMGLVVESWSHLPGRCCAAAVMPYMQEVKQKQLAAACGMAVPAATQHTGEQLSASGWVLLVLGTRALTPELQQRWSRQSILKTLRYTLRHPTCNSLLLQQATSLQLLLLLSDHPRTRSCSSAARKPLPAAGHRHKPG